jgi:hypothetical protein
MEEDVEGSKRERDVDEWMTDWLGSVRALPHDELRQRRW